MHFVDIIKILWIGCAVLGRKAMLCVDSGSKYSSFETARMLITVFRQHVVIISTIMFP